MIELLESRIAPAGVVKITVSKGALSLTVAAGDLGQQQIDITNPSSGAFTITPDAGTQVQLGSAAPMAAGVAITVDGIFRDIKVALGGGNDTIHFDSGVAPKNLTLDGGDGDDSIRVKSSTIAGNLTILGGAGVDSLTVDGDRVLVLGAASLVGGEGDNTFNFTATTFAVGGNLALKGSAGKETINAPGGSCATIAIGGAFSIAAAAGELVASLVPSASLTIGNGLAIGAKGATTPATITFGASGGLFVKGNVAFALGTGANTTTFAAGGDLTILGGFSYTGGVGADELSVSASGISVLGAIAVKLGSGANAMDVSGTSFANVGKGVTVTALEGADTFEWSGGGSVGGKFSVNLGTGNAQTALITGTTSGLFIGKGLAISAIGLTATAGATLTLSHLAVSGKSAITTGFGADTINVDGIHFLGAATISTGAAVDAVRIEKANSTGATTFSGTTKILLGDGNDTLAISTDGVANDITRFLVKWFADGGTGTNIAALAATNLFEPFGHTFKGL